MSSNKISHLNNAYTRNKKLHSAGLMRARKKRAIILISFFLLTFMMFIFQIVHTRIQTRNLINQEKRQSQLLHEQQSEKKNLRLKVKQLYNNDYLEQLIRERYYYTKKGETVYSLPGDVSKDVTQN
ncbi:FtsB family cell division protein [Apilactobacillus xinyiensis]|jgi:cell division protein DivIC|uniref:Septum formation initiator family protein n=1 Tax=Apilactobacillus xinyiensis TaxID=2841032 RepID=A0ABT0I319_9LACO|nr:septum formation initiator family protein [Apilactobacillus xinyiensis]MCK8625143.1 septum formation initiator family protein [Apilactobacillus xinyiensis]MCL0312884.1 septum formation initiator family protein [Apilactobacillus xinyiensis]MCL0319258.1 septum formation initiator family protein [Apilactobacillus xinyiensis]MCL0330482.1 septum formation initiator family protein [Apilactobacillus xinyiensis]